MSYLSFNSLNKFNIINLYSKKPYNFNFHILSKEDINNEINKLEEELNYKFKYVVIPKQSHTTNIEIVTEDNVNSDFKDVDGVLTNVKGIGLGTMSADCQSILLYDRKNEVIGSIHSGWRGTLNGIVIEAINKMKEHFNSNVNDIYVCICPSILDCCFEVEDDVKVPFENKYGNKYIKIGDIKDGKQKYYIDTVSINIDQLKKIGINNIEVTDICVCCDNKEFHSYRADGKEAGRNIGFIGMKE